MSLYIYYTTINPHEKECFQISGGLYYHKSTLVHRKATVLGACRTLLSAIFASAKDSGGKISERPTNGGWVGLKLPNHLTAIEWVFNAYGIVIEWDL